MNSKINWEFLKNYIPHSELEALKEFSDGEESAHFEELLTDVERQIKDMPKYGDLAEKNADEIKIGMHYFHWGSDFWIYELDQEERIGMAFVCLNGDRLNAENGSVSIDEILSIHFMELDLYWNNNTTLEQVMKEVKGF